MKKDIIAYAKSLGAHTSYSGHWPVTLYVSSGQSDSKEQVIDKIIKRFGRHTGIKFA